jgi:hypothetical protein
MSRLINEALETMPNLPGYFSAGDTPDEAIDNAKPDDLIRRNRAWNIAGAHMDGERAARLRAMTDDDARTIIRRIFSGPMPARLERESGLILQQQLFRRLK